VITSSSLVRYMDPNARVSPETRDLRADVIRALLEGRTLPLELLGGVAIPPTITAGLR
jgi:hypothetical protein